MWTSRTRASSSRTAPSPTSPPAASPASARASSASSSRRGISPSTWRRGAGTSSGCGRGGRGSAPPRSSRSSSTCGSTPPKRSRSSWSSRASCARCAARKPSWCRAPPGRRPWRSPAASRTPSRPRPSPTRGREPRAPHLRLGGRAVGGRARRRRGDGVATAPPGGRVRGVRRPEPRGRRCHRARPHGADVGRGIRRGAVEASRALPPACAGARGVPDQALRSRHPGRLPGVPSARRGGGARRRRSRAVLHRAAAVGLGPGAGAPARRREPPRGDPAVRGNVLPRPRRARDVRRASAAGPATAAGPGRGPTGARARPRAPGARAVSREPGAGGAAALAGVPRRRGARAGRAAGRPGRRRRHVARPLSAPGRHPHSLGRSAPRVRRRGRGAVQIGDDDARGGVGGGARRVTVGLAAGVMRLLAATWRYRVRGWEHVAAARATGRPIVYVLWHSRILPLLYHRRGEGMALLISRHRDGGYLTELSERWGYRVVRGSSRRGGEVGLLGLVRALERGAEVALTPDGPHGPAERVKPGALAAAQHANALVVAAGARASERGAWWIRSWDRFCIPKPFAAVEVVYGAPLSVGAGKDGLRQGVAAAERALRAVTYGEEGRGKRDG